MNETTNPNPTDMYFEYYEIHVHMKGRKTHAYLSHKNIPVYFQSQADWFETAADAYRRIKRLAKGMGVFTVERIIEYPDLGPATGPCPELIKQVLDDIPLPYSLTAVAWYEGRDVRNAPVVSAVPFSSSTFYRHRRKLLTYGIDIRQKCNVHIIRYTWDQVRQP